MEIAESSRLETARSAAFSFIPAKAASEIPLTPFDKGGSNRLPAALPLCKRGPGRGVVPHRMAPRDKICFYEIIIFELR
jgi:hypothetical protein